MSCFRDELIQAPRHYWRSLDDLAATPEFRDLLEREFPRQAVGWSDDEDPAEEHSDAHDCDEPPEDRKAHLVAQALGARLVAGRQLGEVTHRARSL